MVATPSLSGNSESVLGSATVQAAGSPKPDKGWSWIAGDPYLYTSWSTGEPDDGNGGIEKGKEQCANLGPAGTWSDDACTLAMGFICR